MCVCVCDCVRCEVWRFDKARQAFVCISTTINNNLLSVEADETKKMFTIVRTLLNKFISKGIRTSFVLEKILYWKQALNKADLTAPEKSENGTSKSKESTKTKGNSNTWHTVQMTFLQSQKIMRSENVSDSLLMKLVYFCKYIDIYEIVFNKYLVMLTVFSLC